jgi:ABC-type dipeptide/oligopeptide/nickel transport system permease component
MVKGIAMRAQDTILFLDFTCVFADSYVLTRHRVWAGTASGGCVAQLRRLSPPLAGSDAPRHGARHLPGDARHAGQPARPGRGGANALSPEAQKNLAEAYGLDKPLYVQFGIFLQKAVRGDFGTSFVYKTRTVAEIMTETFPISLLLGSMALALAVVGGLTLGVLAAVYQNRSWDYVSVSVATLGVSVPNFVLAVFLIVIFSFILPIFPTGGWNSPKDWVLPTVTLALAPMGIIARFTRSSMLEVIRSDYIVTARAKGLAETPVILKHVLKNGFIPVVTLLGPMFAAVGTGSFFVESIFRIPGMGRFFVLSMTGRDYPMIMAVVLIYGAFLALMNLVVDLLYGLLDPRIRY